MMIVVISVISVRLFHRNAVHSFFPCVGKLPGIKTGGYSVAKRSFLRTLVPLKFLLSMFFSVLIGCVELCIAKSLSQYHIFRVAGQLITGEWWPFQLVLVWELAWVLDIDCTSLSVDFFISFFFEIIISNIVEITGITKLFWSRNNKYCLPFYFEIQNSSRSVLQIPL